MLNIRIIVGGAVRLVDRLRLLWLLNSVLEEAVIGSVLKRGDNVLDKRVSRMIFSFLKSKLKRKRGQRRSTAYLPARGPIVLHELIISLSELISLRISVVRSIGVDGSAASSRQVIGSEFNHGNTLLELTFAVRSPINTNIKLNAFEGSTMVDFKILVVVFIVKNGDDAKSSVA